jgi:hypothetical protein
VPTAVHKRALRRAIELAGGLEPLARQLKVPASAVRFWQGASGPLPDDIFLKIVDLVLDRSLSEIPPTPRDPGSEHEGGR